MKRVYLLLIVVFVWGCAQRPRVAPSNFILESRPAPMPELVDRSPRPCPECASVSAQDMWKFTERDFVSVKQKIIELDDYIQYLLDLLKPKNSS